MAYFLCAAGQHYNPGRNYLTYVGVGSGSDIARHRLRLCAIHLASVQHDLAEHEVTPENVAGGFDGLSSDCLTCGEPLTELRSQVFITSYPPDNERKDYWAQVHVDCGLPEVLRDTQQVR